ncbi:hypothetical protein THITH_04750 [Thioalkalivibrio paradoxus ARh 1]|uniref:Uncharacterized protein n=1 Tax=Thioalkalivibrio paradoxus ARh 1 TaxID=713585 RepID=W0DMY1_9GAMM|nr:hypothetical protein THITH_04750 [Thioalkalivibrio paradoxus ARh 1]
MPRIHLAGDAFTNFPFHPQRDHGSTGILLISFLQGRLERSQFICIHIRLLHI